MSQPSPEALRLYASGVKFLAKGFGRVLDKA